MGTWGTGPFANDDAADFANALDEADPARRELLIREALHRAVDADDYLESDDAAVAVAAAAVVAAVRTGGGVDFGEGPEYLSTGEATPLPADVVDLARRALDRVAADDSELRELWEEADSWDEALAALDEVRSELG